jgi:DNA invertase Pin-like site-specific DNA recombinase
MRAAEPRQTGECEQGNRGSHSGLLSLPGLPAAGFSLLAGGALGFARGNGFPGAFGALLRRHGLKTALPADLPAPAALLAEEFQDLFGESLSHAPILTPFRYQDNRFLLTSKPGLDHNGDMKAIGYARVSTDKQADRGVSLEAQTAKVQAMAAVQDAELVEVIVDAGESAKSLNRPGMERLLSLVDSGAADVVIVAKLDRLTRSVRDLAELLERFQRRGVSLVSVAESLDTGSAAGRLVLNIMVSVSQWEREAIGERTRVAMSFKKAQGERVGAVPFGYRLAADGVHLEAEPREQEIIARIRALSQDGLTTRRIAAHLNREGFRLRGGAEWSFGRVAQILRAGAMV